MRARLSAAAALGFGLFATVWTAGAADPHPSRLAEGTAPAAPPASVREVVYFGPAGPVRIRLHVSIDGRPADAVWTDAINSLFAYRDRDADGALDVAERTPFVDPPRGKRDPELFIDGPAPIQPLRLMFNQKDEKVTRAAFTEAVRTTGRVPISLRIVPGRADSKQLSAALFRHLDENGDGVLSPAELKAARERLAVLDIDEDEFITAAELLGRGASANPGRVRVPGTQPVGEMAEPTTDLVFLTADGAQAVKQLLTARGGPRATSLKRAEFGADATTFAALDQDGNGVLDTTELTAWLRKPPDLELAITFDSTGGRLSSIPPTAHRADKNGAVEVALPGGRFRFEAPAVTSPKDWEQATTALAARFKELAKDTGSVERKQLENQPALVAFFDFADRNADGKVDAAEVGAALKALAPVARCRVDVAFNDLGNGLFELLDQNGDGRLSPRELVDAATVLKPYAWMDGNVGPKDLVRQFQMRTVVEPIPVGVLVAPPRQPAADGAPRPALPAWFTKMDRNGDGEVSLREFVGPIELFRKLDRNGDGLISPDEALAAEK
jgi:Ca2+-binding EF-hand superfamily protein